MDSNNLFNKGFPTNRIPVTLPSSGRRILLRETTIVELKSICKTVIDNLERRQMHIIYDATTDYLQKMVLTDGIDVSELTEYDRLFCLMVFFQMSFYKDAMEYKCPNCGVDIMYRYNMAEYLNGMCSAFVPDQTVRSRCRNMVYEFVLGWPKVSTISQLHQDFYGSIDQNMTEELERTQFGINFLFAFVKQISIVNAVTEQVESTVDLESLSWKDRMEIVNSMPSTIVFDQDDGIVGKITGLFVNRLENCFHFEICPQCHKATFHGLSQSSHFYSMFYGSLRGIYGYIVQVECLLLYRYDCCVFDKEQWMTYNDFSSLMKQIGSTVEKDNKERQKMGKEHLYRGLWMIREILNQVVFPEDNRKH